jgi:hypothetical protein
MKLAHFLIIGAAMTTALPTLAAPSHQINTVGMTQPRFNDLAAQCTNAVHPNTLQAVARVESGFNPYAIGVVRGSLKRQPRTLAEAVATAKSLHAQGKNFSMGLMQVNRYNLAAYGLNYETVFEPCKNINAGAKILKSCFDRAGGNGQAALQKAFSCYYSGNFKFGFKSDFKGQPPYVTKIIMSALNNSPHQTIQFSGNLKVAHTPSTANSIQDGYVPQPAAQTNRQPEYIPIPAQEQVQQSPTFSDEKPVMAVMQKKTPPPPEWDVFAYAEYMEKYGEKPAWEF